MINRLCFAGVIAAIVSTSVLAAGLTFKSPDGWKTQAPASSMRIAQFVLPRSAGDTEDADLVVYYFGGSGGSVDANIDRWIAQMQQPDGKPASGPVQRQKRTVNGLTVTLVDVSGTYIAEMTPGAAERHNSSNFRLRAGVVETPRGPYFIKLTGPARTVASWDKGFEEFVASLKYQP